MAFWRVKRGNSGWEFYTLGAHAGRKEKANGSIVYMYDRNMIPRSCSEYINKSTHTITLS